VTGHSSASRDYLEEALGIIQKNDWKYDAHSWASITSKARTNTPESSDPTDAYAAVADVLWDMGDLHGGLQPSPSTLADYKRRHGKLWSEPRAKAPASKLVDRNKIDITDLHVSSKILRHIVIPGTALVMDNQLFAKELSQAASGGVPQVCGYIVDVRGNIGGNMWPMLMGMSPLLAGKSPGAFTTRSGTSKRWQFSGSDVGYTDIHGKFHSAFHFQNLGSSVNEASKAPVAVLIDDGTMSAGEAVATAFSGRPKTKIFGEKTYGLSTNNTDFQLSDGTTLWLATGVYEDRTGKEFPDGISPDVQIGNSTGKTQEDSVLHAAREWLSQTLECKG
jgi:hypothetical protein